MKEEIRKLIETMPINYYTACIDAINEGSWETVQNVIALIQKKFYRNPELHIDMDIEAICRADRLIDIHINGVKEKEVTYDKVG